MGDFKKDSLYRFLYEFLLKTIKERKEKNKGSFQYTVGPVSLKRGAVCDPNRIMFNFKVGPVNPKGER